MLAVARSYSSTPKKLDKKIPIDEAYNYEPWWYDFRGFLILTFAYRSTLLAQIRFFAQNIKQNHLEVAIGSGTLFELILKWRKWKGLLESQIVGFDYADQMLQGARRRFLKYKNIELVKVDAAKLPFSSERFDSVNIANALHCLPEVLPSLKEIRRVLKTDGLFAGNCLLTPKSSGFFSELARRINSWGMRKGILHKSYESDEIRKLLAESGFTLVSEKITGNCFDFVAKK